MGWFERFTQPRVDKVAEAVREAVELHGDILIQRATDTMKHELSDVRTATVLRDRITKLKEDVSQLEIDKAKRTEEFDRREREITHKVGLEKKRQEMELEAATRDARLTAREEMLSGKQEAFQKEMDFHRKRFEEEVKYQRELLERMLERLPTAEIIANFSKSGNDHAANRNNGDGDGD